MGECILYVFLWRQRLIRSLMSGVNQESPDHRSEELFSRNRNVLENRGMFYLKKVLIYLYFFRGKGPSDIVCGSHESQDLKNFFLGF